MTYWILASRQTFTTYALLWYWRNLVWERIWSKKDDDCIRMYKQPHQNYLLFEVTEKPYYLIWWILADLFPQKIGLCEIMAYLVCDTSLLKAMDYRFKKKSFSNRICTRCNLGILENIKHIVMQWPFFSEESLALYESLNQINTETSPRVLNDPNNYVLIIMGKQPEYSTFQSMVEIWLLSCEHVSKIYKRALRGCVWCVNINTFSS